MCSLQYPCSSYYSGMHFGWSGGCAVVTCGFQSCSTVSWWSPHSYHVDPCVSHHINPCFSYIYTGVHLGRSGGCAVVTCGFQSCSTVSWWSPHSCHLDLWSPMCFSSFIIISNINIRIEFYLFVSHLGIEFYLFVSHGGMKRQRVHV